MDRYLALKAALMPRDTNPHGTIFGGVLLSYIDQAGAVGAAQFACGQGWPRRVLVTVGMDRVEFHQPVFVGDVVSFWTRVRRLGTTSIAMHVEVEAERDGEKTKLTEADVTYVAIEDDGAETDGRQPARRPVPLRGEASDSA